MAISTHRAPRVTDQHAPKVATGDSVGPGTYSNTHNEPKQPPGERPVPFSSMQEKKLNQNLGTSAMTPGPGAYLASKAAELDSCGHGHTSLKSKVRRLAPTAPGSSIYLPSTIEKNPGPGAYKETGHEDLIKSPKKEPQVPVRPVLEVLDKTAPSMPIMRLLPGQTPRTEDADVASMVMRHTGDRGDTVGPGEYDPRGDNLRYKSALAMKFHGSLASRNLWEPSSRIENKTVPPRDNPGPGAYEPHRDDGKVPEEVHTSQFASKTPMCHQPENKDKKTFPGPGKYDLVGDLDRGAKSARERGFSQADSMGFGFGSQSERQSTLVRPQHQPYKDPYNYRCVPGPGHYADQSSAFPADAKKKELEKVLPDHLGKKLHGVHHPTIVMALQENTGPLHAFFSTDQRACNKVEANKTPAPGEYSRETARGCSMEAELREKAKVGRKGAFGTCADRFYGSPLEGRQGLQDPGMADGTGEETVGAGGPDGPWTPFASHTQRFQSPPGPREAYVSKVGKHNDTPAPGTYMVEKIPNYRSPFRQPRQDHLSFGASVERFSGEKQQLFPIPGLKNPGPGEYAQDHDPHKVPGGRVPKSARKFKPTGCTAETVGPGSYGDVQSTLLKKTYNVSTAAPVTDAGAARTPRGR